MTDGPVVIGYDGSESADLAMRRAAQLLTPRRVCVVVVWEAGQAFEDAIEPTSLMGYAPAALDYRLGVDADRAMYERAQQLAEQGADLARDLGLDAESLAVVDDITVGDTLVRLAKEKDSPAMVVGSRGHSRVSDLLLGHTAQTVLRHAPCPVLVVQKRES